MKSAYFATGEIFTADNQATLNRLVKLHRAYLKDINAIQPKVFFKESDKWRKECDKFNPKSYNVSFSL